MHRYHGKIQDKDDDYYMQFNLVICGLDSVDARRWMSATLVNLVDQDNPESLKPMVDGGTEGLSRTFLFSLASFSPTDQLKTSNIDGGENRIQRTSKSHFTDNHVLLRMLFRHAYSSYRIPNLYYSQHPKITRALYRVGFIIGVAQNISRLGGFFYSPLVQSLTTFEASRTLIIFLDRQEVGQRFSGRYRVALLDSISASSKIQH